MIRSTRRSPDVQRSIRKETRERGGPQPTRARKGDARGKLERIDPSSTQAPTNHGGPFRRSSKRTDRPCTRFWQFAGRRPVRGGHANERGCSPTAPPPRLAGLGGGCPTGGRFVQAWGLCAGGRAVRPLPGSRTRSRRCRDHPRTSRQTPVQERLPQPQRGATRGNPPQDALGGGHKPAASPRGEATHRNLRSRSSGAIGLLATTAAHSPCDAQHRLRGRPP